LAGRELRFAFVELPSTDERIGSKGYCGCCEQQRQCNEDSSSTIRSHCAI
jgi:hypothetical protein